MDLWQDAAAPMPFRVRPVQGETTLSYVFRLAAANELDRPTTLLRALGEPLGATPAQSMLVNRDVILNEPAQRRLEAVSGIDLEDLRQRLPTLEKSCGEPDRRSPAFQIFADSTRIRRACERCVARLPGTPDIRVYLHRAPGICRRHRRWVATHEHEPHQLDLTETPEIITAVKRRHRLVASAEDSQWALGEIWWAQQIPVRWLTTTMRFTNLSDSLHDQWQRRRTALAVAGAHVPNSVIVLPETITIAEVTCNLKWRRYVALAEYDYQVRPFYRLLSRRLGQPLGFADRISQSDSPARHWVDDHRRKHQETRHNHWQADRTTRSRDTPLPEIRHFR
ncbi:TniQ family protein [Nocardia sp. NPDC005366]|uniref:TniQ family protein n=1 Tax=Nocardia sp. NPDC005366 TaxID=3156878 RepID=UPI0033AB483A